MAGFDVFFGENGQSLSIWFDDPAKQDRLERSGQDLILRKDSRGRVIGVVHRKYFAPESRAEGERP